MATFRVIQDRSRKDPLGTSTLAHVRENVEAIQGLFRKEHGPTGLHNVLEVPKAIGSITYSASYSSTPGGLGEGGFGSLASGHNPAVGTLILTITSGICTIDMGVQVCSMVENNSLYPHIVGYNVTAANKVEFYIKKLNVGTDPTALGVAGNSWVAVDGSFDFAVFSVAYDDVAASINEMTPLTRANGLRFGSWNTLVDNTSLQNHWYKKGHTATTGVHKIFDVPVNTALIKWSGATTAGSYSAADENYKSSALALNRVSTGVVEISLASGSWTTPISAFFEADYTRTAGTGSQADIYRVVSETSKKTASKITVYIYKYTAATNIWDRADADFFAVIHSSGVP